MRPIKLTSDQEDQIYTAFFEKIQQQIDNYAFNSSAASITVNLDFSSAAPQKVKILYTPEAYLRMQKLVDHFSTEVAWYGLVERLDKTLFRVYDVKICKQYVNGAKVDTEDEEVLEFFNSLSDEEAEHMHFQAHSHVKMGTGASGTDLEMQANTIKNMGTTGGFYIFQIWNKSGDINTYLYDLDNNVSYDRKDVELGIEDEYGTLNDYIESIKDLVCEKKVVYFAGNTPSAYGSDPKKKESKNAGVANQDDYDYDWSDYYSRYYNKGGFLY